MVRLILTLFYVYLEKGKRFNSLNGAINTVGTYEKYNNGRFQFLKWCD